MLAQERLPFGDMNPPYPKPMLPQLARRQYGANPGSHHHDFVQLLFCTEGGLELDVAGHAERLGPGRGYVIPEGERHDFAGRGHNVCLVLDLPLSDALAAEAAGRLERAGQVVVAPSDWTMLAYLAGELVRVPDDALLQAAAPALLLRLLEREPVRRPRGRTLPLAALTDYIDAHLTDALDNAALAARCYLSVAQFVTRFQAEAGSTPQAYVRERRLAKALMLLDEGVPVAVVAARVGYASPSALTAALRRERGVTPRSLLR